MGQDVLTETLDVLGEGFLTDSEDDEADVAKNELVSLIFLFLGLPDEPALVLKSEFRVFSSDRRIRFPHSKHGKRIR